MTLEDRKIRCTRCAFKCWSPGGIIDHMRRVHSNTRGKSRGPVKIERRG